MESFFFITSYGRTGTTWLGDILNNHPDICCSHARTFPPINRYGADRDRDHLRKAWENHPIFCKTPLQDWIESHSSLKKARFYGNIHAYNAYELTQKIKEQRPRCRIKMVNLLRHPIVRIQSLSQHWILNCKENGVMRQFAEEKFLSSEQFHELEMCAESHKKAPLDFNDKLFVDAVLVLYNDYNDFSIPIAHIPCERLFSDVDFLLFTIRQLTSFDISFDDGYINFIRDSEPKNVISNIPKTAELIYQEWEDWKKKLVNDVFLTRNIFNLYAFFGYDLSFIPDKASKVYLPEIVLSDFTPRVGVSPRSPYESTEFKLVNTSEEKVETTQPVIMEDDYKGFYIVSYKDYFYAISHSIGQLPVEEINDTTLQILQRLKRCFVGSSIEEVRYLIDGPGCRYLGHVMDEVDKVVEYGEDLFKRGDVERSITFFAEILNHVNRIKGTLLNNIAVIHLNRGDIELAELALTSAIEEGLYHETVFKNLELIQSMKQEV